MITATANFQGSTQTFKVDGLCNKGEWFGKTWLIGIGMGFSTSFFVVEGDNEQDVIDAFVDSKYGHLIKLDEEDIEDEEEVVRAGNCGDPVDLTEVRFLARCKVNYFAKKD